MDYRLTNGKTIVLDKDEVFPDPRAEAIKQLEALRDAVNQRKDAMKNKDLADYSDAELYAELDKIGVEKARLGRRHDEGTDYTRRYWNDRRKQVAAELRRRGRRVRRPGSQKVLPTAAHLAAKKRELWEAAA